MNKVSETERRKGTTRGMREARAGGRKRGEGRVGKRGPKEERGLWRCHGRLRRKGEGGRALGREVKCHREREREREGVYERQRKWEARERRSRGGGNRGGEVIWRPRGNGRKEMGAAPCRGKVGEVIVLLIKQGEIPHRLPLYVCTVCKLMRIICI